MRQLIPLVLLSLAGCSHTLRDRLVHGDLVPDKAYCKALDEAEKPTLSSVLAPFQEQMESKTGVWVLEDGAGAMVSRAWMANAAERSIDIQYFIFSSDNVGLVALDYLIRAADRGVKVRLLIDDLLYDTDAHLLEAVGQHENLTIKIYNPNLTAGKNLPSALAGVATDFRGANQRMHNKTFIIDGQAMITGGRNVADEYFDFNPHYNFRDRDVLILGGVAMTEANLSFEQFWGDKRSESINKLMQRSDTKEASTLRQNLHDYACNPAHFWPSVRARVTRVPELFKRLASTGKLAWVEGVHFVSDDPGKNAGDQGLAGGGITTSTLIEIVGAAQRRIVIQTPYLITSELGESLFAATVKRGVEVIMLTNSLATTDGLAAHRAYQRIRRKLLKTGVKLYEVRPDAKIRRQLLNSSFAKSLKKPPILGLHAKTMVVDDELLVIGTFNLDPRSANLNTEALTLIPSEAVAKHTLELMEAELLPMNAYEITLEDEGPGDRAAGFRLRLRAWLAGLVPAAIL